jgi:serine/threonine-protein kinase
MGPVHRGFVWFHAYAMPAVILETPEVARRALAALPAYEPLPPYRPFALAESMVGTTYVLAGRTDEAIPWLERSTRKCRALTHPFEHTQAHDWLGRAREEKHDTAGACAAYRVVLDRWGEARPRSVTADRTRERWKALGCTR